MRLAYADPPYVAEDAEADAGSGGANDDVWRCGVNERQRDKWEANAIGFTAGGIAAVINAWVGVDLWFIAVWIAVVGIGALLWANWRYAA